MKNFRSCSSAETRRFGREFARKLARRKAPIALACRSLGARPSQPKRQLRRSRQGGPARRSLDEGGKRKSATVIALSGELGSGKTTFIQGFLRGLGLKNRATSPTFVLARRYAIRAKRYANIYHVDAYRIKKPSELAALGFKEILRDPKNIVLIEWADNVKKILPRRSTWLKFHHGKKENERLVRY